jgi:SAM-dependent methyltransferase
MAATSPRPFYGEFAWAYTLLVAAPIARRCAFIAERFGEAKIAPVSAPEPHLLDAGCGPGHYAVELARHGYSVTGIDASADLIAEAERRPDAYTLPVRFVQGDILALSALSPAAPPADAILCRGVLNDLVEDEQRRQAFVSFAGALRPGGALLFDVRDWDATAARKSASPVSEQTVETPRGALTFRGATRLDAVTHRLIISERHTLAGPEGTRTAEYVFTMRCWTLEEVRHALRAAGFTPLSFHGDYDSTVPLGATDRIVCLARRD